MSEALAAFSDACIVLIAALFVIDESVDLPEFAEGPRGGFGDALKVQESA